MAKGYEANEQAFGKGDIALCHNPYGNDFRVKIVEVIEDDDGFWYEVEAIEFCTFNREVAQKQLEFC